MKKFKKTKAGQSRSTSLRKRMIFYFLLIAIANVFVAGEILWELKSESYRKNLTHEISLIKDGSKPVDHIYTIIDNLSRKFVIMILILIVVSAVVLFLFVWQIASPIQYMINQAEKMADGDLSIRIDIKTEDEIAVLGKLINELSINLQEVVAQMERMVYELIESVDNFNKSLEERPLKLSVIKNQLSVLTMHIKNLELLKDTFVLFTIESLKNTIESQSSQK